MSAPQPVTPPLVTSSFLTVPVNPDEGFPQSFLLGLANQIYRFELYVNIAEDQLPDGPTDPRQVVDLVGGPAEILAPTGIQPRGILIGAITRQDRAGDVPLLRRRLLPGLVYTARELLFVVDAIRISVGNLNGAGSYGSVLASRVATR